MFRLHDSDRKSEILTQGQAGNPGVYVLGDTVKVAPSIINDGADVAFRDTINTGHSNPETAAD